MTRPARDMNDLRNTASLNATGVINGREIELKLEVGATDVASVKHRLRQLAHTKPVVKTLVSIYFDTPHWTWREHASVAAPRRPRFHTDRKRVLETECGFI